MTEFEKIPYLRPDIDALEREIGQDIEVLRSAMSFEEAYFAILALEGPRRRYMTLATLCEIRNTMDTNDPFWAGEAAWFDAVKPRWDALCTRLGDALSDTAFRDALLPHMGEEIFRRSKVTGRAFSPAIAAELEEENRLSARYSSLTANLSAELEGKRYSLGELSRMEDKGDRGDREKFDVLRQQAFAEAAAELDTLYGELVCVRDRMAQKLGFPGYTEMGYCRQGRTGYGREEVAAFRREIEQSITPVVSALYERQRQKLGYEELWSFDEDVSFAGDGPEPLPGAVEELFDGVFGALSPESRVYYEELRRYRFYDLNDRNGKIRGAYSNLLPVYGLPFVFESYDGSPGAVKTFAHECGHGLHSFLKRGEPLIDSCDVSSDLCEIHSMAMEFFVWPYLDRVYTAADAGKYRFFHMKSALSFLPYGAAVDEFQTEVYDHPDLTGEGRLALWRSLEERYLPWRKYKHPGFLSEGRAWQRQTHIYKWPFYYIDYVLAQTCALQYRFWDAQDHTAAWNSYLTLLRESGRYSFRDTLEHAGLASPFTPGTVRRVGMQAMRFLEEMS